MRFFKTDREQLTVIWDANNNCALVEFRPIQNERKELIMVFDTNDPKIIDLLKKMGYGYDLATEKEVDTESKPLARVASVAANKKEKVVEEVVEESEKPKSKRLRKRSNTNS